MIQDITLTMLAGQPGVIKFTSISGYGDDVTLAGAVKIRGESVPFTAMADTLTIPALPPGVWRYAVLINGSTAWRGSLMVEDSPLFEDGGQTVWAGNVIKSDDMVSVSITFGVPGPQGIQGPQGETGPAPAHEWQGTSLRFSNPDGTWGDLVNLQGPQGESATDEQIETIVTSEIYDQQETQTRTTQGTDNYNASTFRISAAHLQKGRLTAVSIPCRSNSTGANITYDPVYLTLQVLSQDGNWAPLAVSTNTVVQAINATGRWEFDNVPLDGRDVRACLNTAPTGEWNTGLTMGLRVSSRPAGDTTSNVGGAAYLADVTLTTVIYTEKFTPLEHADDTVAHLSSDEHTALTELIETGGGGTITIDDSPKSGSSNAVSSGGVYNYLNNANVALGEGAYPLPSSYNCSVAIGTWANASGFASVAIGADAKSYAANAIAIGVETVAEAESSCALGAGGYIADTGVTVLNAGGEITDGKSTQLYLIPAGSDMANTYTNGSAGLGFVVLDHLSGSVVARGTIPLASICTQHTSDFSPTNATSINGKY